MIKRRFWFGLNSDKFEFLLQAGTTAIDHFLFEDSLNGPQKLAFMLSSSNPFVTKLGLEFLDFQQDGLLDIRSPAMYRYHKRPSINYWCLRRLLDDSMFFAMRTGPKETYQLAIVKIANIFGEGLLKHDPFAAKWMPKESAMKKRSKDHPARLVYKIVLENFFGNDRKALRLSTSRVNDETCLLETVLCKKSSNVEDYSRITLKNKKHLFRNLLKSSYKRQAVFVYRPDHHRTIRKFKMVTSKKVLADDNIRRLWINVQKSFREQERFHKLRRRQRQTYDLFSDEALWPQKKIEKGFFIGANAADQMAAQYCSNIFGVPVAMYHHFKKHVKVLKPKEFFKAPKSFFSFHMPIDYKSKMIKHGFAHGFELFKWNEYLVSSGKFRIERILEFYSEVINYYGKISISDEEIKAYDMVQNPSRTFTLTRRLESYCNML